MATPKFHQRDFQLRRERAVLQLLQRRGTEINRDDLHRRGIVRGGRDGRPQPRHLGCTKQGKQPKHDRTIVELRTLHLGICATLVSH